MSTAAQITANQLNAQKSSGPTSEAGRAASSQNRRVHGLAEGSAFKVLDCENQAGFDRLLSALDCDFVPQNTVEALLVQRMTEHQWLRNRAVRLQDACFDLQPGKSPMKRSSASTCATTPPTIGPFTNASPTC